MTIKVKYEDGILKPLERIKLKSKQIYEIEIKSKNNKDEENTGEKLLKFAGCIDPLQLTLIKEAIDKECERVNLDEL